MSVYKITDGELVYYGSTTSSLKQRLCSHKCPNNDCETRQMNKDNMTIELIEEVEDKEQLKWRERYYMENNECVNIKIPILTKEEYRLNGLKAKKIYYQKNKELLRQKYKGFYDKNKVKYKEQKIIPYHCECGSVIQTTEKKRHFKTKKHINFIDE